jgi:hypothetical protein
LTLLSCRAASTFPGGIFGPKYKLLLSLESPPARRSVPTWLGPKLVSPESC